MSTTDVIKSTENKNVHYVKQYIKNVLQQEPGDTVTVKGWVKTKRASKGIQFIQLSDGSCFTDLQIVIDASKFEENLLKEISTGCSLLVEGTLVESPAAGQKVELSATDIEIVGSAPVEDYPLQKKGATFEFLREIAHLRCRTNTFGAVNRIRSKASWAIHQFFNERGFHYVNTPIITASDCEGAGEMFYVSNSLAVENGEYKLKNKNPQEDFFAKPAYLTVSGQLEGETLACGLTNVYTFGPTFRAENSNSARHLAEFWMIEPEMAFCNLEGDMALATEFIQYVIKYALDNCSDDIEFFNKRIEPGILETLEHVVNSDFEHVSYTDAIKYLENSGEKFEYPIHWGADLQSEHERWLTEKKIGKPVIVYNYPKEIKAFYMRLNDDNKTVAAMDVLVPKIGEIIGGSQREERHNVLVQRIKEQNLEEEAYWWYLDLRKFGTVPHAGFGLGLERLIMYITGMKNIRDVIPYYRCPRNADF